MKPEKEEDFHRRRASRELDLGLAAATANVARAHFALSSLHLARLQALEGRQDQARAARV